MGSFSSIEIVMISIHIEKYIEKVIGDRIQKNMQMLFSQNNKLDL